MGLILIVAVVFSGFFSSDFCGFCGWRWWGILWVLIPMVRVGFFTWWWWVSCGRDGGDGWLKERDSEEKINRVMGKKGEREIELYYFIG